MGITRRRLIGTGALLSGAMPAWNADAGPVSVVTCRGCAAEAALELADESLLFAELTPEASARGLLLQKALTLLLDQIEQTFGVATDLLYVDDYSGANAFATPVARTPGADGTIMLGRRLLQALIADPVVPSPEAAVAAVCAHEVAHIYQFRYGLQHLLEHGQSSVRRTELHADFLAGYFAGTLNAVRPDFSVALFTLTQMRHGDYAWWTNTHHGTPEERGDAVLAGFSAARRGFGIGAAAAAGARYLGC